MSGREGALSLAKTGIFGGTFNPPHLGHRNIAEGFVAHCSLDRMLIIPAAIPPHKAAPDLASAEDRLHMCEKTFADGRFTIDPIELNRQGKSYTVDTLRQLKQRYGENDEFYFLMGDDMLLYLDKWYEPWEILRLATVVSAVRSSRVSLEDLCSYAERTFPEEYRNGRFQFYEIPPVDVSSTEVRRRVRSGESLEGLVAPEVAQYIADRGLYHGST